VDPALVTRVEAPHFTHLRRRLGALRLDLGTARELSRPAPMYIVLGLKGPAVVDYGRWVRDFVGGRVSRGWVRLELPGVNSSPTVRSSPRRSS
jgi:hypothetical protein